MPLASCANFNMSESEQIETNKLKQNQGNQPVAEEEPVALAPWAALSVVSHNTIAALPLPLGWTRQQVIAIAGGIADIPANVANFSSACVTPDAKGAPLANRATAVAGKQ